MGIFDFFKGTDINRGVIEQKDTPGSVLLDVRTVEEFNAGHIPGSVNIPLQELSRVEGAVEDKATPLFVYCRSGNRSGQAVTLLEQMGYTDAKNIGGILSYNGPVEQ